MSDFGWKPFASPSDVRSVVDDPIFTDVTEGGEVYRTYLITRIVYEFTNHPDGWTHLVEVLHGDVDRPLEAFVRVVDRAIDDSRLVGPGDPTVT